MVLLETGFALLLAGIVILFLAPLVLKAWQSYCGWVFKDRQ